MTSIAILQQYSSRLNYSLQILFWDLSQVGKAVTNIKILYEAGNIKNQIIDGSNVCFVYPWEKAKESALPDVSFRIPAGSLVVNVGANGSGKSTIIKLLTGLYDTDSGAILVDGLPIQDYRLADLCQTQATLNLIMQSAKDGGAAELLDKFKAGAQMTLEPISTAFGYQLDDDKYKSLKGVLAKLEKTTEVSGGEKQRLVASRTFMRFRTGKIKLLCVDEPSSALDLRGEFELFERLRETGDGKTMIFVTHRFGHLTKYADVIICMKEGKVAELGTHKDLMAGGSEYASLYNVQAQVFTESEVRFC
ncbi:P-loop containing nucleoside triphosphate hydrolase protein [Mycena alexandri]|uniref:P-loop containing nucleoside triphosphate hydrolase protein n=1 Tax=Mycena alexandri TaxID=1745969 RepID=A0AAD6S096_9AGAR|nr:P-loop containing nucleoside triphosphate hydrolase protein [Mycena alexandri]